jgi:hypothetical protein
MGELHERVSVGENKYSWMNGGQMGGWMNGTRTLSAEARALCIIYGHLLAPTMSAIPCLASRIGVHADGLKNPIAKGQHQGF